MRKRQTAKGILKRMLSKIGITYTGTESYPKFGSTYKPNFDLIRDLGQIPSIFEWVFNPNIEVATNCARTIHKLLTKQTGFRNKSLYNSLRNIHLEMEDIRNFDRFEEPLKLSLLNIASMNSNGYVREEALTGLLTHPNQFTFQFILFRLGDWVPEIKSKAENAIEEVIQSQNPGFLIRNHKLIDWLLKIERSNLGHIHNYITQFIFSDRNIESIIRSLDKYSDGDRFFVFRNLIENGNLQDSILEEILSDKNYLIRLIAIKNIEFIDNPDLTKRLLKDRSQKIRQFVINKIPQSHILKFKTEIYQLLFDPLSGIRAAARLNLNKIENYNFLQIYRDCIITRPNVGCIVGLAEVGTKNEIAVIERFLLSKSAKIRAASLFAISLLDHGQAKRFSFDLLNDDSNTVKKVCSTIIEKEISTSDLEKLRMIYDLGQNDTRRFSLKTISKFGGWSIAGDFLKGILQPDDKVRETSYALLSVWYKYSIRLGTTQQKDDKNYVMNVYNAGNFSRIKLPPDIYRIIKEIPFIFSAEKNN